MRAMSRLPPLAALFTLLTLPACTLTRPAPFPPAAPGPATPGSAGAQPPANGTPAPGPGQAVPVVPERPPVAPRQFRLGPASAALVARAPQQAAGGDYAQAAATLERAQRIEPDNPLLWIELGRVRLSEGNPAQADAMGRKALALGIGDGSAQSQAWGLIADSLRARGRNGEAAEAEQKAQGLAVR